MHMSNIVKSSEFLVMRRVIMNIVYEYVMITAQLCTIN